MDATATPKWLKRASAWRLTEAALTLVVSASGWLGSALTELSLNPRPSPTAVTSQWSIVMMWPCMLTLLFCTAKMHKPCGKCFGVFAGSIFCVVLFTAGCGLLGLAERVSWFDWRLLLLAFGALLIERLLYSHVGEIAMTARTPTAADSDQP